jgi:hypothetical protein
MVHHVMMMLRLRLMLILMLMLMLMVHHMILMLPPVAGPGRAVVAAAAACW